MAGCGGTLGRSTTREELARRFAEDKERQAERYRLGLEPLPGDQHLTFGALLDRWWDREGRRRQSESKHAFKGSLEKRLGELRPFVLNGATAGNFRRETPGHPRRQNGRGRACCAIAQPPPGQGLPHLRVRAPPQVSSLDAGEPSSLGHSQEGSKRRYVTLRRDEVAPVLAEDAFRAAPPARLTHDAGKWPESCGGPCVP